MKEIKVFRDPLYGYVKVEEQLIWDLIQTKEFQRLRRIHQLGGTYMVYHSAEHSRFSHSLGVYEVARRIIYEVDAIRTTLSKEERLIAQCAALLHDLGHGPYSHAFELVFDTNHEDYSIQIILGDTEVNHVLEQYQKGFSKKVSNIINKTCYKTRCNGSNCGHDIMVSLVTSQLDADRLDYLQRDAYFTGATYGEIDLERIIRSFLVIDNKIAFKYSSMHAIEDYLMSRYHMYWQVYFHPVSVSHEIMLINLFKRIKELLATEYQFISNEVLIEKMLNHNISIEDYLELDESWMIYKIKEWQKEKDPILSDLSKRIINRKLFKYISCKNEEILDSRYSRLEEIFNKYNVNVNYYLYKDTLIKEAYQFYNEKVIHNSPINLYVDQELVEIAEISHIVRGIKDVGAKTDYKIYYSEDIIHSLSEEDKRIFLDCVK
jgi:uncharacterized protein